MNKFLKSWQLIALSVTILFATACDKDDPTPTPDNEKKDILLVSSIVNPDGQSGTAFVQLIKDLSPQTYKNKTSIPFSFGITPVVYKNWIFDPSCMGEKGTLDKLERIDENTLQKSGSLQLDGGSGACQMAFVSDTKAYVSVWNKAKILIINPTTMEKKGEINVSEYGKGDSDPNPTNMVLRDGLLYVALAQVGAKFMPYPNRPYADVLIIDTKTEKPVKMITQKTAGFSYPSRPIDPRSMFMDEKGDIYINCMGYFGMGGHKGGLLRIKKGETEFDDYVLSIPDTNVEDMEHRVQVGWFFQYAGNGKLYAIAQCNAYFTDITKPNYLTDRTGVPIVIDIYNKTIKKLPDMPRGNSYTGMGMYNGKIIFGLSSDNDKGFHIYDPATGKGTPNAIIKTIGEPTGFIHLGEKW